MISTATKIEDLTLNITEEIHVRAPVEVTFAALLEQLGPFNEVAEDKPLPMKLEPWPGGRWYRDLGDNNGHFWGHVQAIKRPTLLEIAGPLLMSYPVQQRRERHIQRRAHMHFLNKGSVSDLQSLSRSRSKAGTSPDLRRFPQRDALAALDS